MVVIICECLCFLYVVWEDCDSTFVVVRWSMYVYCLSVCLLPKFPPKSAVNPQRHEKVGHDKTNHALVVCYYNLWVSVLPKCRFGGYWVYCHRCTFIYVCISCVCLLPKLPQKSAVNSGQGWDRCHRCHHLGQSEITGAGTSQILAPKSNAYPAGPLILLY